jgi:type VI secretion system protein ImpK
MADSDDPFFPTDQTTQRPRPGAGRRGVPDVPGPRPTTSRVVEPEPLAPSLRAYLGIGLNPLLQAASPLLLLTGQLRGTLSTMDPAGLRRHALDEIRHFEDQARASGVRNEIVLAARYALCAGLDEAVLSTPWGAQSEWAQHPLLVALHREAWGGEKFFEMLDRISADPERHIDLLELQYLCLALGFSGKYQMMPRGHEQLADLQQRLYRTIRGIRGVAAQDLSLQWRGLEDRRNRLIRYVPWWVIGAAMIALLAVTFVWYYSRLANDAAPIQAKLALIGVQDFSDPPPAPPVPVPGPTLKQLLAPEEAAGSLRVVENGSQTVVTIPGSDLFASGSADVNRSYEATLDRVAAAINRVPGRVMVVGHTDDQPVKSLRYSDNTALSRERAVSVATILKRRLDSPARVSWNGVGSSQPLVGPEAGPDYRSRNRRVEIIHLRGM